MTYAMSKKLAQYVADLDTVQEVLADLGVTATVTEVNQLSGTTFNATDLTKLHAMTITSTEINKLHSKAVTGTDFTKLHSLTASATELNLNDNLTATQMNKVKALTANGTELNLVDNLTATKMNILKGLTVTATEVNHLDGVTKTATDFNQLLRHVTAGYCVVSGTLAATAEVLTNPAGLASIFHVIASIKCATKPVSAVYLTAYVPAATVNSFWVKRWKATGASTMTATAATVGGTFTYFAVGKPA